MSALKKIEEALVNAPSIKALTQLPFVQERFVANYQAVTGRKDGEARFQAEVFTYLEIMEEKPDLKKADRFSHFAAMVKIGTMGLSLRDSKIYVMPGPNNTIKVQSSPAGKREMMEMMEEIKQLPEPQVVVKGDIFVHDKLNNLIIKHESTEKSAPATLDNIFCSYQRVIWKDGTIRDVVVDKAALLKAKSKSKAQSEAGFWGQWPDEASKKVATNRAYRLYHKYPNNVVSLGKDDDKEDEDVVVETTYKEEVQEVKQEPKAIKQTLEVKEVSDGPKDDNEEFES
jgi:recombinational DNA repair protein RecT